MKHTQSGWTKMGKSSEESEYHPYQQGYDVLPKLNKTSGPFFEVSEDRDWYLSQKYEAVKKQIFYMECYLTPELQRVAADFILDRYPLTLEGDQFGSLMMQIQEDVLIHRMNEERDWAAAGHVCFPSGWLLESKIGKNFEEIHKPIPKMNLSTSRRMVEAMIYNGPFERFVWTVIFEKRINGHPSVPKKRFDPEHPQFWVKVERQLTYGLPEHKAALFILRQHLLPEDKVDVPSLVSALEQMQPEHRVYKGLDKDLDALLSYLKEP